MNLWGITMVRDEMDILPYTLPRMLQQVDGLVVADNMSTDGTDEFLFDFASRYDNVVLEWDDNPAYFQSEKMSALAHVAAEHGADFVVPFDADEVWVTEHGILKDCLDVWPGYELFDIHLYDHVVSALDRNDTSDPVTQITWRRVQSNPLPKVMCKVEPGLVIEQGNHGARYPGPVQTCHLFSTHIHHYPYRSAEQMIRKARNGAAAYAAAGPLIPETTGQHWRDYGKLTDEQLTEVFYKWFYENDPENNPAVVHNPCPL